MAGTAGTHPHPPGRPTPPARAPVPRAAPGPPYSTLNAYDLNTGTMRWRVATGDDPTTIARGGPHDTGSMLLRTGIMPTATGLVFHAGGDNRLRAYDELTGRALWTATL